MNKNMSPANFCRAHIKSYWKLKTSVQIRIANRRKIIHITGWISLTLPSNVLIRTHVRIENIIPVAIE
jgi:hypothetical protein